MRLLRKLAVLVFVIVYVGALTYAGLIFLLAPWSPVWEWDIADRLPLSWRWFVTHPSFRGGVSAVGVLIFVLLAAEVVALWRPEEGVTRGGGDTGGR